MGSGDARTAVTDIIQNAYDDANEAVRVSIQNGLKVTDDGSNYIISLTSDGTKLFAFEKSTLKMIIKTSVKGDTDGILNP